MRNNRLYALEKALLRGKAMRRTEHTHRKIEIIEGLLDRAEEDVSRLEAEGLPVEKLQGDIADYMEQLYVLYREKKD